MTPQARARTQKVLNVRDSWIPKKGYKPPRDAIEKAKVREDAKAFSWLQRGSLLPTATILAQAEKEMPILEGVELLRNIDGLKKTHRFGMTRGERARWDHDNRKAMVANQ